MAKHMREKLDRLSRARQALYSVLDEIGTDFPGADKCLDDIDDDLDRCIGKIEAAYSTLEADVSSAEARILAAE